MSDEESKKYAEELIKIAEDDLEVSRILNKKEYYAFSFYHLQQATEKAVKAYFVKSGINPENLKKMGHTPISPHSFAVFYKYSIAINFILFCKFIYKSYQNYFNMEFYQNYFEYMKGLLCQIEDVEKEKSLPKIESINRFISELKTIRKPQYLIKECEKIFGGESNKTAYLTSIKEEEIEQIKKYMERYKSQNIYEIIRKLPAEIKQELQKLFDEEPKEYFDKLHKKVVFEIAKVIRDYEEFEETDGQIQELMKNIKNDILDSSIKNIEDLKNNDGEIGNPFFEMFFVALVTSPYVNICRYPKEGDNEGYFEINEKLKALNYNDLYKILKTVINEIKIKNYVGEKSRKLEKIIRIDITDIKIS